MLALKTLTPGLAKPDPPPPPDPSSPPPAPANPLPPPPAPSPPNPPLFLPSVYNSEASPTSKLSQTHLLQYKVASTEVPHLIGGSPDPPFAP